VAISLSGLDMDFLGPAERVRGRAIKRWNHGRARGDASKRSDLSMPQIILDRVEYKSPITGEMITSRSSHKEHLKVHDCIELGNEKIDTASAEEKTARAAKASLAEDIKEAYDKVEQGFIEAPEPDASDLPPVNVSENIKTGDVVRADVT